MKVLRYLLYLLLAVASVGIILGLIGPQSFNVSRSIDIAAPRAAVFPWLKTFAKMNTWSPFLAKDSNAVVTTEGVDGTVGAKNSWSGHRDIGQGSQTITKLVENEVVESKLEFIKPLAFTAEGYLKLADSPSGTTTVTWGFKGQHKFIERILFNFMSLDQLMGPEFEKGLNQLKTMVEAAGNPSAYPVTESAFPGQRYAGIRGKISFTEVAGFLAKSYPQVFQLAGDKAVGMPVSITYLWNEINQQTELLAAVAVQDEVQGLENIILPAAKMLTVDFYGWMEDIGPAHNALGAYVKAKNYTEIPPVMEEYITDPQVEPDTAKWLTHVRYFVK